MIRIRGARENNLKNISVDIPKGKIITVVGPSGSGKSSLVFDTIYREAYRRFMDSVSYFKSPYFIEQIEAADVDLIEGLPPCILIQGGSQRNPRSTVGTITQIYDYLRLLFSKIGKVFCPRCNLQISFLTLEKIVEKILDLGYGKKIQLFSPLLCEDPNSAIERLRREGFVRVRIGGEIRSLDEEIKTAEKRIDVLIDRLILKEGIRKRLTDSVELALSLSDGSIIVDVIGEGEIFFSKKPVCPLCGFSLPEIRPSLFSFNNPEGACPLCKGIGTYNDDVCPECNGKRLKKISECIRIDGRSITDLCSMSAEELYGFFEKLKLSENEKKIAERVVYEIKRRLKSMIDLDIGYLSIDRPLPTLSLGEERRLRISSQLNLSLSGILYILDEPTVGLHPKECEKLIRSIKKLKELGNTVLIVEHERSIIMQSDYIIELGPSSGKDGGEIVFKGTPKELLSSDTLTGRHLFLKKEKKERRKTERFLVIEGASEHNLKGIDVRIPLGVFTCITGPSGSGKSTLLRDILYPALYNRLHGGRMKEGKYRSIKGEDSVKRVIYVDQSPIGKNPRSNPATYCGIFDHIRKLFSALPKSKERGFTEKRFSLNTEGGRCELCKGAGVIKVEMDFLPDVYIRCDQCGGKRFRKDILEIRYKGMNIADVLDMTVDQAFEFFRNIKAIRERLEILKEIGLGYIRLGQTADKLSAGEAQRLKIAKELMGKGSSGTIYLIDEPTLGLHNSDIKRLLRIIDRLVDSGNTVVIIEHNLDVIWHADWIIDLGPEGGEAGGRIMAEGRPEDVCNSDSWTGRFLRDALKGIP